MNFIWITSDSFRRDHIGAYGNQQIHTPALDMLGCDKPDFVEGQSLLPKLNDN